MECPNSFGPTRKQYITWKQQGKSFVAIKTDGNDLNDRINVDNVETIKELNNLSVDKFASNEDELQTHLRVSKSHLGKRAAPERTMITSLRAPISTPIGTCCKIVRKKDKRLPIRIYLEGNLFHYETHEYFFVKEKEDYIKTIFREKRMNAIVSIKTSVKCK